ncbi:hypothetical protein [Ulvibacter litoralis]|uniref:Uncharacterized protein n=1 Tax=Ulvibacter litoralis TaxID=227084 RepID=A0A1G7JN17_9FLAO|nr:hypothetical protein [Ulvibacter litoralis]GHC65436.1 hypothetical protein GCM10008083_33300 [Ulvibacter litoralis]SDF26184.1 hypothetical protein SAMN05421855_1199 [Ulvibacter litoralis]
MEIGQKCKINNDERVYKVTNSWKEKRIIENTENSVEYEIEIFVALEEIDNSENTKAKVSTTKVYPV